MKPHLRSLKKGQEVWAIVEETIARGEAIINFGGDLVRVLNLSEKNLRPGQRVLLKVEALLPLQLKLVHKIRKSSTTQLDLDV